MCAHTFPTLCPGLSERIDHSDTGIHWHGQRPGLSYRQQLNIYELHSFKQINAQHLQT